LSAEQRLLSLLLSGPARSSTVMSIIPDVTHPVASLLLEDGEEHAVFHQLCMIGDHEAVDFFLGQLTQDCDSNACCISQESGTRVLTHIWTAASPQSTPPWNIEARVGGRTPLQSAAQAGMPHIVCRLLSAGAAEDYGSLHCNDALERAMTGAVTQRLPRYLQAMLDTGADPNGSKTLQFPPLLACCRRAVPNLPHVQEGSHEASFSLTCAGMLLAAGADPNIISNSTHSCPLLMAAKKGALDLTRLLLEHGAAVTAKQWPPLAAVSLLGTAAKFGGENTTMLRLLLDAGALPVLPELPAPAADATTAGASTGQPPAHHAQLGAEDPDADEDDVPETLIGALCKLGRPTAVSVLCEAGRRQFAPVHPSSLQDILEEASSALASKRNRSKVQDNLNRIRSVMAVLARRDSVAVQCAQRLGRGHCGDVQRCIQDRQLAEDVCDQDGILARACSWRAFGVWDALSSLDEDGEQWEQEAQAGAYQLDLVGGGAAAAGSGIAMDGHQYGAPCARDVFLLGQPSAWDEEQAGVQTSLVASCIEILCTHEVSESAQLASVEVVSSESKGGGLCSDPPAHPWWQSSNLADAAIVAASIMHQQTAVMARALLYSESTFNQPWGTEALHGFRVCAAVVRFALRRGPILHRHHHQCPNNS